MQTANICLYLPELLSLMGLKGDFFRFSRQSASISSLSFLFPALFRIPCVSPAVAEEVVRHSCSSPERERELEEIPCLSAGDAFKPEGYFSTMIREKGDYHLCTGSTSVDGFFSKQPLHAFPKNNRATFLHSGSFCICGG